MRNQDSATLEFTDGAWDGEGADGNEGEEHDGPLLAGYGVAAFTRMDGLSAQSNDHAPSQGEGVNAPTFPIGQLTSRGQDHAEGARGRLTRVTSGMVRRPQR